MPRDPLTHAHGTQKQKEDELQDKKDELPKN